MKEKAIGIGEMVIEDYPQVFALWESVEGMGLSEADEPANLEKFLKRNPGASFVAKHNDRVVGCILVGYDGRRGYLHHLAVAKEYRYHGLGRLLVEKSLARIKAEGINKCHIFVFKDNTEGIAFWEAIGWNLREQLKMMSIDI